MLAGLMMCWERAAWPTPSMSWLCSKVCCMQYGCCVQSVRLHNDLHAAGLRCARGWPRELDCGHCRPQFRPQLLLPSHNFGFYVKRGACTSCMWEFVALKGACIGCQQVQLRWLLRCLCEALAWQLPGEPQRTLSVSSRAGAALLIGHGLGQHSAGSAQLPAGRHKALQGLGLSATHRCAIIPCARVIETRSSHPRLCIGCIAPVLIRLYIAAACGSPKAHTLTVTRADQYNPSCRQRCCQHELLHNWTLRTTNAAC